MAESINDKTGIVTSRIGKENHFALDVLADFLGVSSGSLQRQYIIEGLWRHIASLNLPEMMKQQRVQSEADFNHLLELERQIRQNR